MILRLKYGHGKYYTLDHDGFEILANCQNKQKITE